MSESSSFEETARCYKCIQCKKKIHEAYFNLYSKKCNDCYKNITCEEDCNLPNQNCSIYEELLIKNKCGPRIPKSCGPRIPKPCGLPIPKRCGCRIPKPCGLPIPKPCGLPIPKPCGPCGHIEPCDPIDPCDPIVPCDFIPDRRCCLGSCNCNLWERCLNCYNIFCAQSLFKHYCERCRADLLLC